MTRATGVNEASLATAGQAGDGRSLDELVTAYLPLVYTIGTDRLGQRWRHGLWWSTMLASFKPGR